MATQTLAAYVAAKDKGHRLGRFTIWSGCKTALHSCWPLTLVSRRLSREPDAVVVAGAGLQPGQYDLAGVVRLFRHEDRWCSLRLEKVLITIVCDAEICLLICPCPDNGSVCRYIATRSAAGERQG